MGWLLLFFGIMVAGICLLRLANRSLEKKASSPRFGNDGSSKPAKLPFKVEIVLDPAGMANQGAPWLFYAGGRSKFITEHPALYAGHFGFVTPTFQEECAGRGMLFVHCTNGNDPAKTKLSPYFADLLRIGQAGFLSEYVWWYLGQPTWPLEQQPAQLLPFMRWSRSNISQHVVVTNAALRLVPVEEKDKAANAEATAKVQVESAGGQQFQARVTEALAKMKQGDHAVAFAASNQVLGEAQQLQKEPGAFYACFPSERALLYFLRGHPEYRVARLLDYSVAEALYIKAFLLAHAKRFEDALRALDDLSRLAPLDARAPREKGYILNQFQRSREALQAYSQAWELTVRLAENGAEAGAILRGMGVALIDLGNLDEAEKRLHDSLVVDPENILASNELNYIGDLRSHPGFKARDFFSITNGLHS